MITSPFLLLICKVAGTLLALVSLLLTVQFGLTISVGIAGALAVISIMASYMWPIAVEVHRHAGNSWVSTGIKGLAIVVAVCVTLLDGITNSSTTGTHRVTDVHVAVTQTTNATNVSQKLTEARKTLVMQQTRLADLKKAQGWNASVTAHELTSRMETAQEAIRQEERRGGCGPRCLALKGERDRIAATLGAVTEHNKLADMIVATQAHIEKLTKEVAETPAMVSAVDTQNKKLASLFSFDRNPGEGMVYWTDTWMMVAIGLIITLASQFFNLLAWLPSSASPNVARETVNTTETIKPSPQAGTTINISKPDDIWPALNRILNGAKPA